MSRIVSVHSFRGGTGKSNTTASLATVLAMRGNRVAIVDTDIQSPGIHVLFRLSDDEITHTLNDYLWGTCRIEQAAIDVGPKLQREDGTIDLGQGCLYLVPSSMKAKDITKFLRDGCDAGMLSDGYSELVDALNLDYLFLDTHPGLNEETLLSISVSDVLLLIMRPDKQDFQGTAVTVDVARKLGVPHIVLAINRVLPTFDRIAIRQQMEQAYHVTVGGVLSNSDDIMRLASGGVFTINFPEHAWSREINHLADGLVTEQPTIQAV